MQYRQHLQVSSCHQTSKPATITISTSYCIHVVHVRKQKSQTQYLLHVCSWVPKKGLGVLHWPPPHMHLPNFM